jgi:hypothetical protein
VNVQQNSASARTDLVRAFVVVGQARRVQLVEFSSSISARVEPKQQRVEWK